MDLLVFERLIKNAYEGRNRDLLGMCTNLQCEASELAELIIKKQWYNKKYTDNDICSEAGDILNFLSIILQEHHLTLEDAMENNITKLKLRGWLTV